MHALTIPNNLPLQMVNSPANRVLRKTQCAAMMQSHTSRQGASMINPAHFDYDRPERRKTLRWRLAALALLIICYLPVAYVVMDIGSYRDQLHIILPYTLFTVATYLAPTLIAFSLRSGHAGLIFFLNIFLGWTGIVWLITFILAFFKRGELNA